MAAQLLEPSTAAGKRSITSDAELGMLLDRRKEVFEGHGVDWKSGRIADSTSKSANGGGIGDRAAVIPGHGDADVDSGLFEVYEAPTDEGNDALAHMLGEDIAA
jgi:ATP-dependent DNA helicase